MSIMLALKLDDLPKGNLDLFTGENLTAENLTADAASGADARGAPATVAPTSAKILERLHPTSDKTWVGVFGWRGVDTSATALVRRNAPK